MVVEFIGDSLLLWVSLLPFPFTNFVLLWTMFPAYLNGFLSSLYSKPSNSSAVFAGVVAWWAGADWIRSYLEMRVFAEQINWIIAILFCVYGFIAIIIGVTKKEKLYFIFGKRDILTYLILSFYPVQIGYLKLGEELLFAILIAFIPFMIVLGILSFVFRKILRTDESTPSSSSFPSNKRFNKIKQVPFRKKKF
ncbi:hypothetical protein HOD88_00165 [archaeon]|nr:hypothetical protein [archaeon]